MPTNTRQKIVAANWKMHGRRQTVARFAAQISQIDTPGEVVFAPPFPYLLTALDNSRNIAIAAQTASEHKDGALTGEVSMPMLTDLECRYVIVGHSERRAIYGDSNAQIFAKVQAAFAHSLTPILCIGESDEENQAGLTHSVLSEQLSLVKAALATRQKQQLIIAYEPVWAIGTGRTPAIADIDDTHQKIRYLFSENDDTIAASLRILYGGSIKPNNAGAIFACQHVDGGLVGGASLDIDSFTDIIKALT